MLRAYKYSLLPDDEQKVQLSNFFGAVRFIYNLALETKIAAWTSAKKNLTCLDLCYQLPELKEVNPWLAECPSQSLQSALYNLDNAYTKFFKGGGFPKFKSKKGKPSIQFPQGVKIEKLKIYFPKLKWMDFIEHRPLGKGQIKTVTISKNSSGKYFVSILIDNKKELPKKKRIKNKTTVGIDVGLKSFASLSEGQVLDNPKYLAAQLKRLRVELRTLDRRYQKGAERQSNGFYKQKIIVAKLYEKITNQRTDFLHKLSTSIVKQYDTICIEDLNISGMMQNDKLSRSIADVSWHSFMQMLAYKCEWNGKNLIKIGRFDPSSKICSNCGTINKELQLSDRVWTCKNCNVTHDRDINAAINIKNFGLRAKPSIVNANH